MGFELDPFDDFFVDGPANNARPGGKFKPKAKVRPRKEFSSESVPSMQSTKPVSIAENELSETFRTGNMSQNNLDYLSGVPPSDDNRCSESRKLSSDHVANSTHMGPITGMDSGAAMCDNIGGWQSSLRKLEGENSDIYSVLDSVDDFLPQSTTTADNATNRSLPEVDMSSINVEAESSLIPPETVHVADPRNTETEVGTAVVSPDDHSAWISNTITDYNSPAILDPFTTEEAAISNVGGDFHVESRSLENEETEAHSCLETLDSLPDLTTRYGRKSMKFQPKPKIQSHKEKQSAAVPNPEAAESVWHTDGAHSVPSQTVYIDEGSIPEYPSDCVIDFSSLEFGDSIPSDPTFEFPVNEEATNLMGTSQPDAAIAGEQPETVPEIPGNAVVQKERRGKEAPHMVSDLPVKHQKTSISGQEDGAGRSLRRNKRKNGYQLVDESEDEDCDDGQGTAEGPNASVMNEDNNACEEVENEPQNKRMRGTFKKPVPENGKAARKRKQASDVLDQSSNELSKKPKKFSHSTRKRGRFDKDWLKKAEEDDIDLKVLPIKDIILLGEYREWMEKKTPKPSETPSTNRSAANSSGYYNEEYPFASDQGQFSNDEEESPVVQETYFNYHTHMEKTPRGRWSKQDTELFYEAVGQFGTDLSMITELFPGRTRSQIKLKYKKEERQHPMRLHEALTNRSKDLSHFELVVERLRQTAAERRQNRDDSDGLPGEDVGEVAPETNEEVVKSDEQLEVEKSKKEEEVQDTEAFIPAVESPVKSSDSEDDFNRWSQYKSEL